MCYDRSNLEGVSLNKQQGNIYLLMMLRYASSLGDNIVLVERNF